MSLKDAYKRGKIRPPQSGTDIASLVFGQRQSGGFTPTQPGDPDFGLATTPSSQAQFPAAAAEKDLFQNQRRAGNVLSEAQAAGVDVSQGQFDPLRETAEKGFTERALTMGERMLSFIDGGRQAANLLIQDIVGGKAEEGKREVNFRDYMDALWMGVEDPDKFEAETGLDPSTGSKTLDLLGWDPVDPDATGFDAWTERVARFGAHIVLDTLIDPTTYVTFGLSGLGRKVAMGAAQKYSDEVVGAILPAFKKGVLDADKIADPYMRKVARMLEDDVERFAGKLENMDPDTQGAIARYLKTNGHEGLDPNDTWAVLTAAQNNMVELTLRNRVRDDVMAPLVGRDFAAIDKDALDALPAFAHGGARIAVPFTKAALEKGIMIPGTQGLGKRVVGDPLRKMSKGLREKFPGTYNKLAGRLDDFANNMDQDRALLKGVAEGGYKMIGGQRQLAEEGIEGWQYHLIQTATDRLHNKQNKEIILARLNSLKVKVRESAAASGIEDESKVWATVMNRLEGSSASELLPNLVFGEGAGAPGALKLTSQLDQAIEELAGELRSTFDAYHAALGRFDPTAVEKYIKGYAPHQIDTSISALLGQMAAKGATKKGSTVMRLQQSGDPGAVLFAEMLNAIGKGGRLESQLGASRYLNPRKGGRLAAITLTDRGTILFDETALKNSSNLTRRVLGEGGEVAVDAMQPTFMTASEMNDVMGPIVRQLADEFGLPIPKDWDGKVFNTNPLDIASSYINNLDEAISAWATVEALQTAGLVVRHTSAPNVQGIINEMMNNVASMAKEVQTTKPAAPVPGSKKVPVAWLRDIVDPLDDAAARMEGSQAVLQGVEIDPKRPVGQRVVRKSTKGSMEELAESISREGMRDPILVGIDQNGDAIIINGHHRLAALESLGEEEADVVFTMMRDFDPTAEGIGVNVRPHLRDDIVIAEPGTLRVEERVIEPTLSPEEDQLARKFRNGIARTNEQSTLYKEQMAEFLRTGNTDTDALRRAEAGYKWYVGAREQVAQPLYRTLNDAEIAEVTVSAPGEFVGLPWANVSRDKGFVDSSKTPSSGEKWVATFEPGTFAAENDLNQQLIRETGKVEDELFVSGFYEVTKIDHDARTVQLRFHEEYLPEFSDFELPRRKVAANRPDTAPGVGPMFHGSANKMVAKLSPLSESGKRGDSGVMNLYGPGFYSTSDPDIANTLGYGGGRRGTINRLEWTSKRAPVVVDLEAPVSDLPEVFKEAVHSWADEVEETVGKFTSSTSEIRQLLARMDSGDMGKPMTELMEDLTDFQISLETHHKGKVANLVPLNQRIQEAGIDALAHEGGRMTGGRAHDVTVWLSTDQLKLVEETGFKTMRGDAKTAAKLGISEGQGTEASDIFKTVPWANEVTETNILKGFEKSARAASKRDAVPIGPEVAARRAGFSSVEDMQVTAKAVSDPDAYDNVVTNKLNTMSSEIDPELAHYDMATRYGFEDAQDVPVSALGKDSIYRAVETTADGGRVLRRVVGAPRFADEVTAKGEVVIDAVIGPDGRITDISVSELWPASASTRDNAVKAMREILDEAKVDTAWTRNALLDPESMGSTEASLVWEAMLHKINDLPDKLKEQMTAMPAEHVTFQGLWTKFSNDLQNFFNEYAVHFDSNTGDFLKARPQIAGDSAFVESLKDLRATAKRLKDEEGLSNIMDVFKNTKKFVGLADKPGFVNPAIFALGGPALEGMTVDSNIAEWLRQLTRNQATIYTPEGVAALKLASNNVLRWWKAMATIARPGFHIRNAIGGIWSNMMVGVGPAEYLAVKNNGMVLRNALREGLEFDQALKRLPKAEQAYWRAAWDEDVLSGFVSTEFRKLDSKKKATIMSMLNVTDIDNFFATRVGGKFMESIEDFLRMSAFRTWYDPANPASAKVAREMVDAVHFNYSKLTPMETKIKSIVPFFVWSRRNLPRQLEQYAENPRMIQRYRHMMDALDDVYEDEENGMPGSDHYSAYAAETGFTVNRGTPFWARVFVDPDLPVRDLVDLPNPTPQGLLEFANQMVGPHVSTLVDMNAQRDFGDVNAPAPFNAVLRSLAAVGFYDKTIDGDVRIPYWQRTIMETAMPWGRDIVDPLTGGPSDPGRQARLGIGQDAGFVESSAKTLGFGLARAAGVQLSPPTDVKAAAGRTDRQIDDLVESLRLQGQLPPQQQAGGSNPIADIVFGG